MAHRFMTRGSFYRGGNIWRIPVRLRLVLGVAASIAQGFCASAQRSDSTSACRNQPRLWPRKAGTPFDWAMACGEAEAAAYLWMIGKTPPYGRVLRRRGGGLFRVLLRPPQESGRILGLRACPHDGRDRLLVHHRPVVQHGLARWQSP
jgi:hypothetical protein